jgi:NADH:ubiquinone oxidoreductase subunit E
MNPEHVAELIENHRKDRGGLITLLEDIQSKYSYLPEEALRIVAQKTGQSLVDVYGVATFFKSFSLKPRGKHLLSVCLGTASHVRGGQAIAEEMQRQLGIKAGETTPDKEITFETVNCLGACALGPIVVVDGHTFSNVARNQVKEIIHKTRVGLDHVEIHTDERIFPVEVGCPHCNHSLMDKDHYVDGYPSIRVTASFELKHGWIRLSCLYGSFSVDHEYPIPSGGVVNFFCPHCDAEVNGASRCVQCGAPMVPMLVRGGGILQICSRRGCKGHMLDLKEVSF